MPEAEDAQNLIKKRARRRLLGAVALATFAVIVFPLVMDHDPGPLVQDIEIRIPGQHDKAPHTPLAAPLEAPPSQKAESKLADVQPPGDVAPQPSSQPISVTPPVVQPLATSKTEPAKESAEKSSEKANGKSVQKEKSDVFVILIGAFSQESNVRNLRSKLTEHGIKSFTEPLGDKTRVRAGPFQSREQAEKALQKMKSLGLNGHITNKSEARAP